MTTMKKKSADLQALDTNLVIKEKVSRAVNLFFVDFFRELYSYAGGASGITREAVKSYFQRNFYVDGTTVCAMVYDTSKKATKVNLVTFNKHAVVENDMITILGIPVLRGGLSSNSTQSAPYFHGDTLYLKKASSKVVSFERAFLKYKTPEDFIQHSIFYHSSLIYDQKLNSIITYDRALECFRERILQLSVFGALKADAFVNDETLKIRLLAYMKLLVSKYKMSVEEKTQKVMDLLPVASVSDITKALYEIHQQEQVNDGSAEVGIN